jgi:hypothetical protein
VLFIQMNIHPQTGGIDGIKKLLRKGLTHSSYPATSSRFSAATTPAQVIYGANQIRGNRQSRDRNPPSVIIRADEVIERAVRWFQYGSEPHPELKGMPFALNLLRNDATPRPTSRSTP